MTAAAYPYDAFISYRRQEPDKAFARWLLKALKAAGYRVAFDEIDFSPQKTFLTEMERCCQESRFVLAVISPRYFDSGNAEMEATMTTVQGMSDRNNRLIPLIYEDVTRPLWMYSLVGVNFTDEDPLVPPLERLQAAMGPPQGNRSTSSTENRASPISPPPVISVMPNSPASNHLQARLTLMKRLSGLQPAQFEQIAFALQHPAGSMPGGMAPLGHRVAALLNWAEGTGGCGLDAVETVLAAVLDA